MHTLSAYSEEACKPKRQQHCSYGKLLKPETKINMGLFEVMNLKEGFEDLDCEDNYRRFGVTCYLHLPYKILSHAGKKILIRL